jgi:hypothetical protein
MLTLMLMLPYIVIAASLALIATVAGIVLSQPVRIRAAGFAA